MNYSDYPPEMCDILDHLSVRGLALWGMALLDPCCAALRDGRDRRPLVQPETVEFHMKRTRQTTADIELRFLKSIDKALLEVPIILKNILHRKEPEVTRRMLAELPPRIEGLDFLVVPLNSMGHSIYAYMSQMDWVWDEAMRDAASPDEMGKPRSLEFVHGFCIPMLYVAGGFNMPPAHLVAEFRIITKSFIMPEARSSTDPIEPEIPAEVIASVLAPLRFFKP